MRSEQPGSALAWTLIPRRDSAKLQVLHFPAGTRQEEPLVLSDQIPDTHLLVVLEEGSVVHITDVLQGGDPSISIHHSVEIFLGEGADITFLLIEGAPTKAQVQIQQQSLVGVNARLRWQNVTLGGREVEHDLRSVVRGAHAVSEVDWVFYARDEEHQRLSVRNVYEATGGGGEITLRGVAEEKAQVSCRGMIEISPGGGGTDTYLTEDVLMLDRTAKVDAIPGLEIKTNDVKASHSATVTRVTPEDLFYFSARGIPEHEARAMYIQGFLSDLAQKIGDERSRLLVLREVERKYERRQFQAQFSRGR